MIGRNHVKPTPVEFEISDDGITHKPTDYSFRAHPGNPGSGNVRMGRLGNVLPDGRNYRPHEVEDMAKKLWGKHVTDKRNKT